MALEQALVDRTESQHEAVAELSARVAGGLADRHGRPDRGATLAGLVEHTSWASAASPPPPLRRRLVTLGHVLEDADDAERTAFPAHVRARLAYKVLDRRQHARATAALRIPLQRT